MQIGERISDPHYQRVFDLSIARVVHRLCPACSFAFTNCEVPLAHSWNGTKAECCPACYGPGACETGVDRDRASSTDMYSIGLAKVMIFGGVYRRRRCMSCQGCGHSKARHKEGGCWPVVGTLKTILERAGDFRKFKCSCQGYQPCMSVYRDKEGPTRWSTGEFNGQGLVVADVTRCPRCNTKAPVVKRSKQEYAWRGRVAKKIAAEKALKGGK